MTQNPYRHTMITMASEGKLEELITAGFAEMRKGIKDLKDEMTSVKEEVKEVKKTAAENTRKIGNQSSEITALQDQMRDMISSDQDHRRRAGRR